jgi:hypothetical protein
VSAIDNDATGNLVTFRLLADFGAFSIGTLSGTVKTTIPLDREQTASFRVVASAFDSGNPPRFSDALIDVTVVDQNDNPPVFLVSSFILQAKEDVPSGSVLLLPSPLHSGLAFATAHLTEGCGRRVAITRLRVCQFVGCGSGCEPPNQLHRLRSQQSRQRL